MRSAHFVSSTLLIDHVGTIARAHGAARADGVGGLDENVWEPWTTTRTEDRAGLPEGIIHGLVHQLACRNSTTLRAARIKLAEQCCQPRTRESIAWRKLEQEAAHPISEQIGDKAEVLDEGLCAAQLLSVRDELTDLDRVNKVASSQLPLP